MWVNCVGKLRRIRISTITQILTRNQREFVTLWRVEVGESSFILRPDFLYTGGGRVTPDVDLNQIQEPEYSNDTFYLDFANGRIGGIIGGVASVEQAICGTYDGTICLT